MNIFLIADLHVGHTNCLTFKTNEGIPLRPYATVEEMDAALEANWNSVVRPQDKVYVLGDLVMHKRNLPFFGRVAGEKVLIKGNHDIEKLSAYTPYFKDIRACHQLDKFILTHIPIHPQSLSRWKGNIHGHLHSNKVMLDGVPDPRYICVSVEQINFTPISLETLKKNYEH